MKKGFTLVELSIVLVIIGLLIGGILVGQSLIESAKINAQVKQFQQYDIATTNFKNKFKQVPGDSNLVAPPYVAGGQSQNGNNNGTLVPMDVTPTGCGSYVLREAFIYFPQLSALHMLQENYISGWDNGGADTLFQAGYTFPKAKLGDGGIFVQDIKIGNPSNVQFFYYLGAKKEANSGYITQAVSGGAMNDGGVTGGIKPAQALSLDKKMDNGIANSGKIVAVTTTSNAYSAGCSNYTNTYYYPWQLDNGSKYHAGCNKSTNNAEYDVSDSTPRCRLGVKVEMN